MKQRVLVTCGARSGCLSRTSHPVFLLKDDEEGLGDPVFSYLGGAEYCKHAVGGWLVSILDATATAWHGYT